MFTHLSLSGITIETVATDFESDVDCYIRSFLSNRDNVLKVIGLDVQRTIVEVPQETEDYHNGSHRSNKSTNELKPTGNENTKTKSQVAILQLCDGDACLIIQLPFLNFIPNSLLNFLQLPEFTFAGIGIKETVAKLEKEYGLGCNNAVELGPLAASVMQMPKLSACGMDVLCHMLDIPKLDKPTSVVFSDWGKQSLNRKQIKFAASNVLAYFMIGNKLLSG